MPFALKQARKSIHNPDKTLWFVVNTDTGKRYSKKALTREQAVKQLRAMYIFYKGK